MCVDGNKDLDMIKELFRKKITRPIQGVGRFLMLKQGTPLTILGIVFIGIPLLLLGCSYFPYLPLVLIGIIILGLIISEAISDYGMG